MHAAVDLQALLHSLPGQIRRGHAPASSTPSREERIPTGLEPLDRILAGGIPRGQLSEILARGSAGGTSLAQRAAASVTAAGGLVSWIDMADAFDPASAAGAGVDLSRLLWIRPPDLAAGLRAADALLGGGGFPLVLLDVRGDASPGLVRRSSPSSSPGSSPGSSVRGPGAGLRIRSHVWVRLARAAARARSALLVLRRDEHEDAGPSAALRLRLAPQRTVWNRSGGAPPLLDGLVVGVLVVRNRGGHSAGGMRASTGSPGDSTGERISLRLV